MPRNVKILFIHPENRFIAIEESYIDHLGKECKEQKTLFLSDGMPSPELQEKADLCSLVASLCAKGLSRPEIADKLEWPYRSVWRLIDRYSITCKDARNPIGGAAVRLIPELRAMGWSNVKIAEKLGCSAACVTKYKKGDQRVWRLR